jgi:Ca-activated chloride channel family protein
MNLLELVMRHALVRRVLIVSLGAFASLATARSGNAQGWIVPRPCWNPAGPALGADGPIVPRDCAAHVERTRSDVRVELSGRVLQYEVEERFINHGGTIGEADYLFPLPNNAAFQDLKLSINGELVSGETMDASRARSVYESIVRARRDPALVEWVGHGLVRARIFPLNPGEEKHVIMRFQSVAPLEGGALRIDYLRGGDPSRSGAANQARSTFAVTYRPTSDLGTPYSPTHQLSFADSGATRRVSVRGDARDVTMLIPMRAANETSISMLPNAPGNEDGFALITVSPPAVRRDDTTPRDVTLVLDVSGSMNGRKIEQARAAGRQLLGTLRSTDRFRLVDFSSDVRTFRDAFVDATAENVRQATSYLDALEANGGTNIEGALREALRPVPARGRLPLVLFVTDGEPTVGDGNPDHLATLVRDANARATAPRRIFTFGLGSDVNVTLLEQLALDGRGTSQFVRPDESVERMVGVVADRLVDPVLTDVRVHAEGDTRLLKMLPEQASDIFADRGLVLFARYAGHGPSRLIVEGNRRGVPVRWTSTVDFPERTRANAFVARLWATQRVGFLSAEKRKHGSDIELDDEIKSLGERYSIPTEFTSYLVVEPALAVASRPAQLASPAPLRRAVRGEKQLPMSATVAGASASSERDLHFEAAKVASAQRVVTTAAVVDSIASSNDTDRGETRRVDGRRFVWRDSSWTDARYHIGIRTTTIRPYSAAYFDLLTRLPELRSVFALGDGVIVVGKDRAIALADGGLAQISASELTALAKGW